MAKGHMTDWAEGNPTFEPEFLDRFIAEGLEAALRDLLERCDLDAIEVMVMRATIQGFVSADRSAATGTSTR